MITAFFIFDAKGDVLMSKMYKEGVKRNVSDVFRIQVISANPSAIHGKEVRSPILTLGSTSFVYIKANNLWLVAVTRSNHDCAAVLEFLFKFEVLLKSMLTTVSAENLINNFFVVYQVLDEVVQFGYPVNLEPAYLKALVPSLAVSDGFKLNHTLGRRKSSSGLTMHLNRSTDKLGSVTWRDQGIKYRRNEIFVNVDEEINVLMNEQGEVLTSSVDGKMNIKAHLSGMPNCTFGLNDNGLVVTSMNHLSESQNSVVLQDCKFHQCVELNTFDKDRVIKFVPPDGEFSLMGYNCISNVNVPFKVYTQVQQLGHNRLQYKVRVASLFQGKLCATDLQIRIPTPSGVLAHYESTSAGKTKFHPEENILLWKLNKLYGDKEVVLTAEVEIAKDANTLANWPRPPISLKFLIEMFSCSGLSVNYLKIHEKANYRTVKWVKYSSRAGSYEIRY